VRGWLRATTFATGTTPERLQAMPFWDVWAMNGPRMPCCLVQWFRIPCLRWDQSVLLIASSPWVGQRPRRTTRGDRDGGQGSPPLRTGSLGWGPASATADLLSCRHGPFGGLYAEYTRHRFRLPPAGRHLEVPARCSSSNAAVLSLVRQAGRCWEGGTNAVRVTGVPSADGLTCRMGQWR
jgi:hypothetical protein